MCTRVHYDLQEYCESALELQASKAQELFQFVLGAAHLWDVHLSDLQGEERKMDVSSATHLLVL